MYDMWGIVLDPPESGPREHITPRFLWINSEVFIYWSDNYSAATCVYDEARAHGSVVGLLTVRSTAQTTQSDLAVLYPRNTPMAMHPSSL